MSDNIPKTFPPGLLTLAPRTCTATGARGKGAKDAAANVSMAPGLWSQGLGVGAIIIVISNIITIISIVIIIIGITIIL